MLLVVMVTLITGSGSAFAQSRKLDFKPLSDRQARPAKPSEAARKRTCSEYGAGFYRAEGSDTCVRIGGGIDMMVSSGRSGAPR